VDVVDWVESIPISETRNYVQRVLENVQVYRHRIGGTQIALSIEQDLRR
jgi:soluble lytic murein transglycosylase